MSSFENVQPDDRTPSWLQNWEKMLFRAYESNQSLPDINQVPVQFRTQCENLLRVYQALRQAGELKSPPDQPTEIRPRVEPHAQRDPVEIVRVQGPDIKIDGFEIQGFLGRGLSSDVFAAHQTSRNRKVALKVLRHGTFIDKRIEDEIKSTVWLTHSNIIKLFEVIKSDDTTVLVLEYADRGNLRIYQDGQPVAPEIAARFVRILARALAYAHKQRIIHRDLKPDNILLFTHPSNSSADSSVDGICPKIADFGLAKLLSNPDPLTLTGQVFGTPAYMAPEQASGNTKHVGPTADIYGLGTILYELVTGVPPFQGTLQQIRHAVVYTEPARMSALEHSVPPDLERIQRKCMAKAPCDRYQDATELIKDLSRFLNQKPVLAKPPPLWRGPQRFVKKHWLAEVILVSALFVLTFGGVAWFYWNQREEADNLTQEAVQHAEQSMADLLTRFDEVAIRGLQIRSEMASFQQSFQAAAERHDRLCSGGQATLKIRQQLGDALVRMGWLAALVDDTKQSQRVLARAEALFVGLANEQPKDDLLAEKVANVNADLAVVYILAGDRQKAGEAYGKAAQWRQHFVNDYRENRNRRGELAIDWFNQGCVLRSQQETAKAATAFAKAVAALEEHRRLMKPYLGTLYLEVRVLQHLGEALAASQESDKASKAFGDAVTLLDDEFSMDHRTSSKGGLDTGNKTLPRRVVSIRGLLQVDVFEGSVFYGVNYFKQRLELKAGDPVILRQLGRCYYFAAMQKFASNEQTAVADALTAAENAYLCFEQLEARYPGDLQYALDQTKLCVSCALFLGYRTMREHIDLWCDRAQSGFEKGNLWANDAAKVRLVQRDLLLVRGSQRAFKGMPVNGAKDLCDAFVIDDELKNDVLIMQLYGNMIYQARNRLNKRLDAGKNGQAEEFAEALKEARILVGLPNVCAEALYDSACAFSLASKGQPMALWEEYSFNAASLLRRAFREGFGKDMVGGKDGLPPTLRGQIDYVYKDTDLDEIRRRPDYKELMAELESKVGLSK